MKQAPPHTPHELLASVLAGEAIPMEVQELNRWRAADPAHEAYFQSLRQIWEGAGHSSPDRQEEIDTAWRAVQTRIQAPARRSFLPSSRWAVAASVALLATIGVALWMIFQPGRAPGTTWTQYAANDSLRQVTLPDGSVVDLRQGAQLWVESPFGPSDRKLQLEGTAFFDVTSDPERPFRVEANEVQIEVLGTQFQVDAASDQTAVFVEEGKVAVRPNDQAEVYVVAAGYQLIVRDSISEPKVELLSPNRSSWRNLSFEFQATPLSEVVRTLSDIYGQPVDLASDRLGACRVQARFEGKQLEYVLTVIGTALGLEWTQLSDGSYLISGEGCLP